LAHLAGVDVRWYIPIREIAVAIPDDVDADGARLEHVQLLNPNQSPIRVVPYDPRWRDHFVAEAAVLRDALSPHALAIAHIGSTAVPGLPAKPIIDMMVGLRSLADTPKLIQPLQTLGYRYAPEYETTMPERRYFTKAEGSGPAIHLHVVELGSPFWERHIAFRDYLKRHPEVAAEYAALKTRLAEQHRDQRHAYTEGKSAFISAIEARALAEARGEPALLHAGHAFTERQAAE
ncbi:MAG: GrpB family protein, partial [Dehalococcoidia bacterium]|nr:GrpB family protein [Dehalococcoidia bacterium]